MIHSQARFLSVLALSVVMSSSCAKQSTLVDHASARSRRVIDPQTPLARPTTANGAHASSLTYDGTVHVNDNSNDNSDDNGDCNGTGDETFSIAIDASTPFQVCDTFLSTVTWEIVGFDASQCVMTRNGVVTSVDNVVGSLDVDISAPVDVVITCDDGAGHNAQASVVAGAELQPPPQQQQPSLALDVTAVSSTFAEISWTSQDVDGCVLAKNNDFTNATAVNANASDVIATGTDAGLTTYTVRCNVVGDSSTQLESSRAIFWGNASSVQDFAGARAIVGDFVQQTTDFQTDYTDADLRFVSGAFEVDDDPIAGAGVAVTFSALETVGAGMILVDNAGVASFSFPALTDVGVGIDITGNTVLDAANFPALVRMGTSGTFAAQNDPLLSCDELASIYCGLEQQGNAFVPACPAIVPGC